MSMRLMAPVDIDDLECGKVYIRCEMPTEDRWAFYGPVEWVQLTYDILRDTGDDPEQPYSDALAVFNSDGLWSVHTPDGLAFYSDIVMHVQGTLSP